MSSSNNNKRLDLAKTVLEKITHKNFKLVYHLITKVYISHLEIMKISNITQQSMGNHLNNLIQNNILTESVDKNYEDILIEEYRNRVTFIPEKGKVKVFTPTSEQHVNGVVLTQYLFENREDIFELLNELVEILNKIGKYLL